MRLRFLIADLMVLTIPCAVIAFAYQADPKLLGEVAIGLYLAAVCLATLGAKFRRGNRKMKMFYKGYALFGWFYFVMVLQFGFDADRRVNQSLVGTALAFVCAYATYRLVRRDPCPGSVVAAPAEAANAR